MRLLAVTALAALAAGCTANPPSPQAQARAADRQAAIDAELADALKGKVAGKAVSCINLRDIQSSRNIGEQTILYEMSPRLTYRNDPPGGCKGPGLGRTLVTRTTTSQLCRGDIARVVDLQAGFEGGSCVYADFVPYRRPG